MKSFRIVKTNPIVILFLFVLMLVIATASTYAASVPNARGHVNSSSGVVLRKSSSTKSKKVAVLQDNTELTIYKEVFKKKTSTSKKNIWYYVLANGKKGYIRADLVNDITYGSINGKVKNKVNYRKGAGTKMKKAGSFKKGTNVTVCLVANPVSSTKGSSKKWYKVRSGSKYYYVCSKHIKLTGAATSSYASGTYVSTPGSNMSDAQFETYMTSQGFPEAYKKKLRVLHKAHPNWGFVGYKTGINWSSALASQTRKGVSLIHKCAPSSYRSGSSQPEPGWYNAKSTVVAYYMDPRNFLNETSIYMFEDLSYKPSYQTAAVVNKILSGCKLPQYGFTANLFVKAGANNNTSPVFLASRARQETGSGGAAVNGQSSLGKVYNPFNIGAYGGTDPLYNGLVYAKAQGWNTPEKAINGGAASLAKYYINQGQYTTYYQRFNARNGAGKSGAHQYMTNIQAPCSEAISTENSYTSYGITGHSLVFEIPIYDGMPSSTNLP